MIGLVMRQHLARKLRVEFPRLYDSVKQLVDQGVSKDRILLVSFLGSPSPLLHFAVGCAIDEILAGRQVIEGVYEQTQLEVICN